MATTAHLEAERQLFGSYQNPQFFEAFFHVDARDKPGKITPLRGFFGQLRLDEYLEDCRQFNLYLERRALAEGGESYIENLAARKDEDIEPHEVGVKCLVGKSRRGGFSTWIEHIAMRRISWLAKYEALVMAHDAPTAETVNEMVRLSYDTWPAGQTTLRPSVVLANRDEFKLSNRSRFAIKTAGQRRTANEKTRGWKFDFYHFSEYAHYFSYADAVQAEAVARKHAWIIKESTANGKSGPFYNEWQAAATLDEVKQAYEAGDVEFFKGWNGQYRFFFSWLEDPGLTAHVYDFEREELASSLTEYERWLFKRFPDLCTLGRIKWRRMQIAGPCQGHETLSPEAFFMQEWPATPEEMFQATSQAIFDAEALDRLHAHAKCTIPLLSAKTFADRPPKTAWVGGANTWVYQEPRPGHSYVIGADVAHGVGRDSSVFVVLDRLDGTVFREVAAFKSNTIDPKSYGHILTMFGEWYNDAFINCEVMGPGLVTNETIVKDNRYSWVYHRKTLDMVVLKNNNDASFRYGFWTNEQGKHALIGTTRPVIKNRTVILASPWGVEQLKNFEEDEKGRLGIDGVEDDYVIALSLAVWSALRAAPPLEAAIRAAVHKKKRQKKISKDDEAWWQTVMRQLDGAAQRNKLRGPGVIFPSVDDLRKRR